MNDELIKYPTAKLAKKKKFPQHAYSCYRNDGRLTNYSPQAHSYYLANNRQNIFKDFKCVAVTQSLLQRWLREVHKLHITIYSKSQESWMYRITKPKQDLIRGAYGEDFYTYEEALEDALLHALKLIK